MSAQICVVTVVSVWIPVVICVGHTARVYEIPETLITFKGTLPHSLNIEFLHHYCEVKMTTHKVVVWSKHGTFFRVPVNKLEHGTRGSVECLQPSGILNTDLVCLHLSVKLIRISQETRICILEKPRSAKRICIFQICNWSGQHEQI